MKIMFVAGFAPITSDPSASAKVYRDLLGLPLKTQDDYLSMEGYAGVKHFGVWPLRAAAQSCFGANAWPSDVPIPHATIEFELADVEAVEAAVEELEREGQKLLHKARLEPWGQTVARFLSPEGLLIGLSYAPWLHSP